MIEEVEIQEPEQQQPDPPKKKLWKKLNTDNLYTKSFEDFDKQFSTPESVDKLYKTLSEKKLYTKTAQEFNQQFFQSTSEKKNPSEIGSKEPSVGGLVGDGTTPKTQEPIPTVMLVNGEAVPSNDAIALSLSASKLKNAKKEIEVPSINKAGYTLEQVPDEEKLKDYENIKSEIKKLGYDADELVEEFSDFPQDAFRNPSTTKEVLLDLRKNNLVKYHQLLNETKNRYAIRQAAAKKTYDNLPSDTPHGDEIITNNAVIAGNAYVEDGVVNDVNELQNSIRKKQYLINTYLTGEERDKANQRLKDTYSNEFNRNTRFLQDDYTQSPFKSILDIDQYAALKGIEVLDPSNYEQIVNQLNVELQPEYRLNIPMSGFQAPVAASPSITTTDSNMVKKYGGSETGESIDKRTGKEGVLKMLLDIGRNNALTNIKKNEDDLVSKFNNSTDYNEKTELKLLYDKLMTEKQSILESKNMDKQRFPLISKLEFNQQVKDMVNDTDMSAGGYYLNRFLTNIASTQHGTDNFLINIFGSDKQKAEQRLKTSGYSAWKQGLLYLPESLSKDQSPVEIQVSDDLRKKVKEITGGAKIEDWTQTQKEAVNKLVADNQREIKYITNTKENDKNFISKATGYSMAGFLGDISALFYQMAGGKALGGKSAEMMVMGLSGYENGYETGIGEGLSDDESHDKGIMEGMINMVAARYGSRLDYAKKMAAIENPSLSKALNNISDDVWNKVVSKNQTIISRIKKTAASVVPENAKQIAVWGGFVPAANMIAEDIFSDKDYTAKEIFNQTAKSLKHMAIDQLAIAPLGIVRGLTKKPFSFYDKSMLWEIGSDAETTKMQISEDIANNVITKEVGDARLKAVDNVSKLINKVPRENDNGNKLSDKERINYLYNIFIADKANEAQKSLPPKQAEKADHKAKVAEYSNQILLDQATPEKLQKRKEQLEKSLEPKKDAEGKTIEIPEKELAQYKAELEAVNDAIETREKGVTVEKGNLTGESIPLKTKEDKPNNAYTDQYNKALENPDQREQALQEISDQWHDPRSRKLIEESIAPEIIKEAKEKYPKEETTTKVEQPTVSETEGKSDVVDKASNVGVVEGSGGVGGDGKRTAKAVSKRVAVEHAGHEGAKRVTGANENTLELDGYGTVSTSQFINTLVENGRLPKEALKNRHIQLTDEYATKLLNENSDLFPKENTETNKTGTNLPTFESAKNEYDAVKEKYGKHLKKDGGLRANTPDNVKKEIEDAYTKMQSTVKHERDKRVSDDKRDTGLIDGIERIKDNTSAFTLVRMAMNRGVIPERQFNEFGKNLLHIIADAKDSHEVTMQTAEIIQDFSQRANVKVDDALARELQAAENLKYEPVEQSLSKQESGVKTEIKNEETKTNIPNAETKDSIADKGTTEAGKEAGGGKEGKYEAKARKLAEKIMASETPDWLKIDDPNVSKKGAGAEEIKKALADATIKMGKLLDKGVEFSEAVKESVKDLVNMLGEGARTKIEEGFAKDYKAKTGDEFEQRRFTKQMLRSDELSGESKAEIAKTLNYVRQKNVVTVKEANEVLEKVGVDEAQNLVINDSDLKPAVRVTLGQIVIKKYNALSETATDQATKDYYLDKSIQTASFVTEKLGTEAGQSIQAFSMWAQLSPEGQLRAANQDMARQGKEKLRRREKDIKVISDKFQKANEEAAEEITNSPKVKETVKKTKTAQDKVASAKKKIDDIIKKHKADKGKTLYAGVGLTKEGIEFVGDLVSAYVQLGGAKLEVVVEKVLAHLKDVSGKTPNDTVRKNVNDLVKDRFEKDENARMTEGLSELEAEVNKIIKEHYTVSEEAKTTLIDKFMEKAGLDKAEATRLAKEVEAEFEKIATRKKRNILYNEKARFDKINKTLKGSKTPEQKTLATEIIKYSNLGAFEGKEFGEMIASKFGLGEISPEQAAKLIELAKRVEKAPEGSPKNNATEDLLAYRAKLKGNDLGETVQSVWYANVLSGYKTQEKNLVSTFFNSMADIGAEMAKDPKSIPYMMAGYIKGVFTRGLVEAGNTMKTGYSPIHIKKIEVPNALERKKFVGGAINPGNWLKYVMRTMIATDVLSFQGLKEARAYQLARREVAKNGVNTWSKKGWDEVNKVLLHTKERLEMAEAQVAEEGITGKLEKKRRIFELMEANRPTEMMEDAYGFAAHGTFNHESEGTLGAITNAVAQSLDVVNIGGVKPARFIVPFTRIITNVVNNSLDYSPVGFIRAARGVRGFRSFEGNRFTKGAFKELSKDERTTYLAKAALGITLAATFQAMHQAGVIQVTGGGTGNYQKDEQLRQEGWQEYSIKVGGKYYSYKYTPLVFMLGYLGNMNDAEKYSDNDKETILKQMEVATSRIGGQVADMTWINSAATFLGALTEPNPSQQASGLNKSLAGISRGFVPFAGMVTQLNDAFATDKKEANNAWQGLMASIPIARNSLDDRINALGDPVKVDIDVISSKETTDPVWKFLLDKQGWVAPVNKNTAIIFDNATKQDRLMTTDEYYNFSKLRGGLVKDGIQTIMNTREIPVVREGKEDLVYVKPSDLTKQEFNKILTKIKTQATKLAKDKLTGGKNDDDIENDNIRKALNKEWNKEVNEIIGVEEDDN